MSYLNGEKVLPPELLAMIRQYVQGACIYIPREKSESTRRRDKWIASRDRVICKRYQNGTPVRALAGEYFLSVQAIYKIIAKNRK